MTADDIADELVALFNGLANKPIEFQAENPLEVGEALVERDNFKVFVVPKAHTQDSFDRADSCRVTRTVQVIVNGRVSASLTKKTAMSLVAFLEDALQETSFGRFIWEGSQTLSLYDGALLKTSGQFLSLFEATYYDFA